MLKLTNIEAVNLISVNLFICISYDIEGVSLISFFFWGGVGSVMDIPYQLWMWPVWHDKPRTQCYHYKYYKYPPSGIDGVADFFLLIIWLSNLLILSVSDEGYSRNMSCALHLISTGFFYYYFTFQTWLWVYLIEVYFRNVS